MKVERNVRGYPYLAPDAEGPRVWVSNRLVEEDEILLPQHAAIERTEKGTPVLRPRPDAITVWLKVDGGYRGGSSIEIKDLPVLDAVRYRYLCSPRGSLGDHDRLLVTFRRGDLPQRIPFRRWGRRITEDESRGYLLVDENGEVQTVTGVQADEDVELSELLSG